MRCVTGAGKESHLRSNNRGDSESDILEQTPDTDDSGPHSCPGEWTKHSNANSNKNIHQHKTKKIHKVTSPPIKEISTSHCSQKVRCSGRDFNFLISKFHVGDEN